jgi:hypothetical protein
VRVGIHGAHEYGGAEKAEEGRQLEGLKDGRGR